MVVSIVGLLILVGMLFLRIPLFIAMISVGTVGFAYLQTTPETSIFQVNWKPAIHMLTSRFLEASQNYGFSVIPLFIFMGGLLTRSGISKELYQTSYAFMGHQKGGLANATIVACAGFAAICGSSLATVATMAKVSMDPMKKKGYSDRLASATIVAGGTLGILIPPSVILIIYGILTETSIRELFAAGLLPGILGAVLYILTIRYSVWRDPSAGPAGEKTAWPDRIRSLKSVIPVLFLFVLVLGGIYLGVFTPTEAAGIGAAGAIAVTVVRGTLTFAMFREVMQETVITTCTLFAVIIGAGALNSFAVRAGLPDELLAFVQSLDMTPMMIILIITLIYFILGMFLDSLSMILLTIPVFFPVIADLNMDLVWFGIYIVVVTEISLITPPIGMNVFVLSSVLPKLKTSEIFKGVTPFWIADIIRLLILIAFPAISLFLPQYLYH